MSREIRSPVYQIDFTAVDAGKRIASTKRRIRWRFGFTNQDALAAGETGTACRGEEHDITLIWSLTSGKRLVLADGQEVHYSNSRSQIFDFSWTMRGNHVLKVVAHGTTPVNAHPTFRQYDFFVDGMSFFSMPKVYRLGLTDSTPIQEPGTLALAQSTRRGTYGNYTVGGSVGGGGGGSVGGGTKSSIMEIETPHNEQEEEAYLREAIKASLSEQIDEPRNHSSTMSYNTAPEAPKQQHDLLIDFMSEPNPAPSSASLAPDAFAMVPAPNPPASVYAQPPPPFGATAPPPQPKMQAPAPAPVPVQPAPNMFAPAPMSTLPTAPTPPPFAPAPMAPPQFPAATPAPTPSFSMNMPAPPSSMPPAPVVAPAPAPEAAPALTMAPQSTGLGTDANAAYAKFANMDQFDLVKPKGDQNGTDRANPFDDPVAPSSNTVSRTLADMKAKNNGVEKKTVMNNNSMVVAQTQGGNFGGYNNYSGLSAGATAAPGYGMGNPMGAHTQQMQYQTGYPQQQPQYGMPQQQVPPQFQQAYGAQPQQPF